MSKLTFLSLLAALNLGLTGCAVTTVAGAAVSAVGTGISAVGTGISTVGKAL